MNKHVNKRYTELFPVTRRKTNNYKSLSKETFSSYFLSYTRVVNCRYTPSSTLQADRDVHLPINPSCKAVDALKAEKLTDVAAPLPLIDALKWPSLFEVKSRKHFFSKDDIFMQQTI